MRQHVARCWELPELDLTDLITTEHSQPHIANARTRAAFKNVTHFRNFNPRHCLTEAGWVSISTTYPFVRATYAVECSKRISKVLITELAELAIQTTRENIKLNQGELTR